ncbi:DUF4157 domain-containing protein [Desmonostoc muscorum LEGE 12446]|nr:DUF4157 domain-containing protein [Desmonostoc muscorum]MCF2147960.1 DUF4157 domain-containing protein [Desmonostoc muscorum LEGE 12446]
MSDRTFGRKKTAASNFSNRSLVSPTTPTLANPVRGFGLATNNLIQTQTELSTDQQEAESANEQLLEQQALREKPITHDMSRISLRRPQASAQAFTHGSDVYFGEGKAPENNELTHVVQQTGNQNSIQRNLLGDISPSGTASSDGEDSSRLASLSRPEYIIAQSGSRYTLLPLQPNGQTLYFFYGYEAGNSSDQAARDSEAPFIEDDVIYAARSGFTVVYDLEGTAGNFAEAIFNPSTYGIYWSGHGDMQGNIWTSDNILIRPEMISRDRHGGQVSPNLRYFILAACGSAQAQQAWQLALPQGCQFEGWLNLTSNREGVDFTDSAWSEDLDQLFPHGGLHPDRELRDYIEDVRREGAGREPGATDTTVPTTGR